MMPALVDAPPEGDSWLHEIKYDGYRTQLVLEAGGVRAFTRRGHDWSERYRRVVDEAAELKCESAIIEGEMIVQDEQGRSDFAAFRETLHRRPDELVLMAFDLLHLNGQDLRRRPLEERRGRLEDLIGPARPGCRIAFSTHVVGGGPAMFGAAERMGLEGVVSKKSGSRYRSGHAKSWLKIKTFTTSDLIVIGVERGDRAPVALLAWETEKGLEYAGGAMITLPTAARDAFWGRIEALKVDRAPLATDKKRKEGSWVEPRIRLKVKHLRGEEMLRHATVEEIVSLGEASHKRATPRSREPTFPMPEIDRKAVLAYYKVIAPAMLPWVRDRPLNLFRCLGGRCFFQRNVNHPAINNEFPVALRRIPIEQKNGRTEEYLWVRDEAGIIAAVESEAVEFHGWGSSIDDIERPNRIAFDLDPGEGVGFEDVKMAALQLRVSLAAIDLQSWPLLTGGKGIHVVVPFQREAHWSAVRSFARRFCAALAGADADRFTVALPKARRRGRIFLDYLRNQRSATAILPYSLRARNGLPVAAPITWAELPSIESAAQFAVGDASGLLRRANSAMLRGWGISDQSLPH